MRKGLLALVTAVVLSAIALPAQAIQCVPYARQVSGIDLQGDAWKWWNAAVGRYDRGRTPQADAVMVFSRQGSMRYGHVSVVSKVVNSRMVLVDHANWAPVRSSGRGAITKMVPVLDVSPKNDWTRVRVWYEPSSTFGSKVYRTDGFVYNPARRNVVPGAKPSIQKVAARTSMALAHMGSSISSIDTSFDDEPVTQAAATLVEPAMVATLAKDAAAAPVAATPVKAPEIVKAPEAPKVETAKTEAAKAVEVVKTIEVAVAATPVPATEVVPDSTEANDNLGSAIVVAKTSFGKRPAAANVMFN